MSQVLEGVLVVDLTSEFFAQVAAAQLADFGADVIRVEDLGRPAADPDRDGMHPKEAWDSTAMGTLRAESCETTLRTPGSGRMVSSQMRRRACPAAHCR